MFCLDNKHKTSYRSTKSLNVYSILEMYSPKITVLEVFWLINETGVVYVLVWLNRSCSSLFSILPVGLGILSKHLPSSYFIVLFGIPLSTYLH